MSRSQSFGLCLAHVPYVHISPGRLSPPERISNFFPQPYGVTFYDILQWLIFMFCITCSNNKDMSFILYFHNLRREWNWATTGSE